MNDNDFYSRKFIALLMGLSMKWDDADIVLTVKNKEITVGMKAEIKGKLYGDYVKFTPEEILDCEVCDVIETAIDNLGCELGRIRIKLGVKAEEGAG